MASHGCFQMPLTIGRHIFHLDLIILESQGLDVILGMDWLSLFEGNINCANKSILLTTQKEKDQVCFPACDEEDSSKFLNRSCAGGSTSGEGFP